MKINGTILLLLLLISGCEKSNNIDAMQELLVGTWKFTSFKSKQSDEKIFYPDSLEKYITIEITSTDTIRLVGNCNSGMAVYFLNDNNITITGVNLTEKACISAGGAWEWEDYLYELRSVSTYKVNNENLSFFSDSDIKFNFSRIQ